MYVLVVVCFVYYVFVFAGLLRLFKFCMFFLHTHLFYLWCCGGLIFKWICENWGEVVVVTFWWCCGCVVLHVFVWLCCVTYFCLVVSHSCCFVSEFFKGFGCL